MELCLITDSNPHSSNNNLSLNSIDKPKNSLKIFNKQCQRDNNDNNNNDNDDNHYDNDEGGSGVSGEDYFSDFASDEEPLSKCHTSETINSGKNRVNDAITKEDNTTNKRKRTKKIIKHDTILSETQQSRLQHRTHLRNNNKTHSHNHKHEPRKRKHLLN
jgi:hypothetical protein